MLVSQSGRSAEIVRLLEMAGERVETLGVTNTADSPLAAQATAVLLTHAGEEATVACKTHLATQMALAWLGTRLTGGDTEATREALATTIPAVRRYLEEWRAHVEELATDPGQACTDSGDHPHPGRGLAPSRLSCYMCIQ